MVHQSRYFPKSTGRRIENALPKRSPPLGAGPSTRLTPKDTWEVVPSPMMVLYFQSAPIRAISGQVKIGGHPAPCVGEVSNRGEWPDTKGADPWREVCPFGTPFSCKFRPWEAIPQLVELVPPTLHRVWWPMGVGIWGISLPN